MRFINTLNLFISQLVVMVSLLALPAYGQSDEGGMISWSDADMAGALSIYIPRRIEEEDIPGLSIAVVKEGRIVYERGFGTADYAGDEPVTANTLFEAASLGKPVAALGALHLVQEGELALDRPLGEKLDEVWLGDGDDQALITLRQVLNHTSGLSNVVQCCSNESWFEPGTAFSYSGVGYMYLAHVMSVVREMGFDRVMHQIVFEPLGMMSSGYGLADFLVPTVARGQVPLFLPVLALLVPIVASFALFSLFTIGVVRFYLGRLRLELTDLLPATGLATVFTIVLLWVLLGGWDFVFVLGYTGLYLALLGLMGMGFLLLFAFLGLLGPADGTLAQGREQSRGVMVFVAFAFALLSSFFFAGRNVPVPAMGGDVVNAAFSFRSSAHDMGRFIEGMLDDRVVRPFFRQKMAEDSVDIGDQIGWGLGIGTRDGARGRSLWQWGSNPGFESLMVIDPARRAGIVIMTNSSKGASLVQEVASHVMGEEPGWQLP
ncbi:MAG: beta-lactamase family protein [Alphaproteobacteria bacterium]|nr:beta-lactamase family protein [Alphaproteobacteria bacterium]MBO6627070.1 beta-lactamase family protein [Alphaproteobacteria bacterium]MDF1626438.1 serine hydrolase [Parvibaculaceae bacterium]